ncbi:membrane-spanning 4-domains subfamily A member 18-like [Notolabrus celidotus]|uniref:membrane-spanning 4-domains subfamily A member 18-like n=1 Tax=Notolabrus celidotus TaxID=1203425 RepID=UPI00148FE8BF|nr:membrane-spanning 4-domains subfamily A member 18-like [Notolabrus celidotus]
MSASPPVVTAVGQVFVVTQGAGPNSPQETRSRIQVSVIGTLQIVIGLMILIVQLALVTCADTLGLISGAVAWGPLSFIVSGSLTVSTATSSRSSLVSSSLTFSMVAVVTSAAAVVINVLDAAGLHVGECVHNVTCCDAFTYWVRSLNLRLSLVLTGFCLVEYILATLSYVIHIITNNEPQEGAPERTNTLPIYEAPPHSDNSYEMAKPDEYDTNLNDIVPAPGAMTSLVLTNPSPVRQTPTKANNEVVNV